MEEEEPESTKLPPKEENVADAGGMMWEANEEPATDKAGNGCGQSTECEPSDENGMDSTVAEEVPGDVAPDSSQTGCSIFICAEDAPVDRIENTHRVSVSVGIGNAKKRCVEKRCGIKASEEDVRRALCDFCLELPVPRELKDHSWRVTNEYKFELGSSSFTYVGGIANGQMHGFGRLAVGDGEYMEGKWQMNRLVDLHSCQLITYPVKETVLINQRQNDHLLTMLERHYVARVTFEAIEELDFTTSIAQIKSTFFRKLTVLELVADEVEQKRRALLKKFVALLSEATNANADSISRANIFFRLSLFLGKAYDKLSDAIHDRDVPVVLRDTADELINCEKNNMSLLFLEKAPKLQLDLKKVIGKVYNDRILTSHRQMLIDKCPKALPRLLSLIQELPNTKIVYVTLEDMNVFDHLVSQPCFEHFEAFFADLVERYGLAVQKIEPHTAPSTVIPIMSPVYGFFIKSFWETVSEIIQTVECYEYKDMLQLHSGCWKLQESIKWPESGIDVKKQKASKFFSSSGAKSLLYHRALEVQYKVIFQILTHFSPENYIAKKKYKYDCHVLEEDMFWWEKDLKMTRKKVGLAKRLENMTGRLAWLRFLDQTIHEIFKDDPQPHILLKPYKSLIQGQISLIEKSSTESHEIFRVTVHSVLKFITSTAPYFQEAQEKPGIDVEILVQQMWTFSTALQEIEEDEAFANFRDLIAEYNRYLNLRLFVNTEAASGHFSAQISKIMETFMHIVANSLKKSVSIATMVAYFRSLNDFLDDFKNIDFLSMYFVKSDFFDPDVLDKVDNNLTGGNCSYRVTDIKKFVQIVQVTRNQPVPRHHIIQVVSQLLQCIATCLDKQWLHDDVKLDVVQLESTSLLLDAIRKSFMYLKEQPDYVDFDVFEKESTDPFVRLVHDCETLYDLKKRIGIVSESFWYIRKMDEIGIEQALAMFKTANDSHQSGVLLDCYTSYLRHYNEYIAKFRSVLSEGKSHAESLDEVLQILGKPTPMHFSMWSEGFKTKEIPVLLAGLSAVWSFLMSKDVSSAGKFLKPHCIQIICILRLLSVDQSEGVDNHLAQVLTGQGKSVILGLLSSLLALTGHKVRVLCYSNYLSTRDQEDFKEFFQTFQLAEKIQYGTFKEMADSFVNPVCNGSQISLRQLVKDRANHASGPSFGRLAPVSKDTVLLVDEVDVFFTDRFYGNSYCPASTVGLHGLEKAQEFIWAVASNHRNYPAAHIAQLTKKYIADEVAAGNKSMLEFNEFLNKPGNFPLLTSNQKGIVFVKTYTNASLFDEHLLKMVHDALKVRNKSWARSGFKLSADGILTCKNDYDIYSESYLLSYRNSFNYFRLKKCNFDSKNFRNYGYLNLKVGEISYARLPLQFPLVLGVSGTLTYLGDYEKSGLQFYGIHNTSVLPSFFGESNLEFNELNDFRYFHNEQDWLKEIYNRANRIVESHRAVLVFFESDVTISIFSKEYKSKFNRMNEITENTLASLRDVYINEAGLPGTVTLATRGMGRGIDYKSSLTVEKNGGVHVVQTFFSVDVKEEVQIKGRTARKDNKGSYELIISREHLIRNKIIRNDDHSVHTYFSLDEIRKWMSEKKGKTAIANIKLRERNHSTTMKYFGLV